MRKLTSHVLVFRPIVLTSAGVLGCCNFENFGPLSQANLALPWIIFSRDRMKFEQEFPEWRIKKVELHTPFSYLLSGGISLRGFMAERFFKKCRQLERLLVPWIDSFAMFATVSLLRVKQNVG